MSTMTYDYEKIKVWIKWFQFPKIQMNDEKESSLLTPRLTKTLWFLFSSGTHVHGGMPAISFVVFLPSSHSSCRKFFKCCLPPHFLTKFPLSPTILVADRQTESQTFTTILPSRPTTIASHRLMKPVQSGRHIKMCLFIHVSIKFYGLFIYSRSFANRHPLPQASRRTNSPLHWQNIFFSLIELRSRSINHPFIQCSGSNSRRFLSYPGLLYCSPSILLLRRTACLQSVGQKLYVSIH